MHQWINQTNSGTFIIWSTIYNKRKETTDVQNKTELPEKYTERNKLISKNSILYNTLEMTNLENGEQISSCQS